MAGRAAQASRSSQKNFTHLLESSAYSSPYHKNNRVIPSVVKHAPNYVKPRDRIPFWNIEPEDKVFVHSGNRTMKNQIGTVAAVNRERNLVFCKETQFNRAKITRAPTQDREATPENTAYTLLPIHYSNCSLVVPPVGAASNTWHLEPNRRYFYIAKSIRRKHLRFSTNRRAWNWVREVVGYKIWDRQDARWLPADTSQNDPARKLAEVPRFDHIKWARERKLEENKAVPEAEPTQQSTSLEAVQEDTFNPLRHPWKRLVPELHVPYQEFGNVHSRAKRTAKWNSRNRNEDGKIVKAPNWSKLVKKRGYIEIEGLDTLSISKESPEPRALPESQEARALPAPRNPSENPPASPPAVINL